MRRQSGKPAHEPIRHHHALTLDPGLRSAVLRRDRVVGIFGRRGRGGDQDAAAGSGDQPDAAHGGAGLINLRATLFNTEKWADLTWERWVTVELPALAGHPGMLIASIGHTPAEGEVIAGPVVATGVVDAIECVAYTKATIVDLVRRVREQAPKMPILAKLTFNWGDGLYPAAEEALKTGADGFTVIDSMARRSRHRDRRADHRRRGQQSVDIGRGDPAGGAGGRVGTGDPLSGRADRRYRRHYPG